MTKAISFLAFVFSTTLAFATNTETCGQIDQPVPYSYCITKTVGSTNQEVLYFFHGGGGSENQWNQMSPAIYAEWTAMGAQPPVVITISFGEYWLLVDPNGAENSGLLPVFAQAVIPQMENLALGAPAAKRSLMGLSMGGFNGTQVLAKLPPETFSRVALVCPALVDLSPFASQQEILEYSVAHKADIATLNSLSFIAKAFVLDEATWDTQVSPYALVPNIINVQAPLLIAINQWDNNFKHGGEVFAQSLLMQKQSLHVESWSGGHCDLDEASIAAFFTQP